MTIRIDGTNTTANPGITGADADTGLQCGTDELNLVTGGTARVKIASDGAVQLLNSTGIDFSGIQTNASGMSSETLDSYEEGTWTPVFAGATSDGSYTYTVQTGVYTKIGNRVTVDFKLLNIATGSAGSGNVQIRGLPFTAQNAIDLNAQGSARISQFNVADSTINISLQPSQNDTYCTLCLTRDNSSNNFVDVSNKTGDGADIFGSVTYSVG